jgi:hypothetical protein
MSSKSLSRFASVAAAILVTSVLSGCVIAPAGPYYYHPHPYWYYR